MSTILKVNMLLTDIFGGDFFIFDSGKTCTVKDKPTYTYNHDEWEECLSQVSTCTSGKEASHYTELGSCDEIVDQDDNDENDFFEHGKGASII